MFIASGGPIVGALAGMMKEPTMMDFYQTGNVFIKRMYFDFSQGYVRAIGHSHKHDHVTLLAFGVLNVKVGEKETTYHAPATINIEAGKHHEMTALMDKTVAYCIHDTRGLEVEELGDAA